jgi:hypothetical protein
MPIVTVHVLFFASAREAADGISELKCEIGDENDPSPVDTALLRYDSLGPSIMNFVH